MNICTYMYINTYEYTHTVRTLIPFPALSRALLTCYQARALVRNPQRKWRHSREQVERKIVRAGQLAAVCGLAGTIVSIVLNEMMVAGNDASTTHMTILKAFNSAWCVAAVWWIYQVRVIPYVCVSTCWRFPTSTCATNIATTSIRKLKLICGACLCRLFLRSTGWIS